MFQAPPNSFDQNMTWAIIFKMISIQQVNSLTQASNIIAVSEIRMKQGGSSDTFLYLTVMERKGIKKKKCQKANLQIDNIENLGQKDSFQ